MLFKRPFFLTLFALIVLTGCGGGGSSHSPPDSDPDDGDTNTSVTVSGVATKGLLRGAKVTAYELDDAGNRLADAVGSAETDTNGAYELELTEAYTGGVIEVEVSVIEGTRMICDATQCGSAAQSEEVSLPSDFVLSAIVEKPSSSNTVKASVTAWSSMAAKRAKAILATDTSKSVKDAARQANSEVSQVVGFDISATESRDLSQIASATGAQAQYAVMNAVVAELLFQGSDGSDLTVKLNSFASALEDGVFGDGDDSVQLADLAAVVRQVAENVELDAVASEAIDNQTAQYDAAGEEGFVPEYDEDLAVDEGASDDDKIAAFQSFVTQTRTWVSQVEALNDGSLSLDVDGDVATVEAILVGDTQDQFLLVGLALDQVSSFLVTNAASIQQYITEGAEEEISITDELGTAIGTATLTFADDNGLQISISGAATGEHSTTYVPFSLTLDTNLPTDALTAAAEEDEGGTYVALNVAKLLVSNNLTLSGYVGDAEGINPLTLNELSVTLELDQALEGGELDINSHFKSAALAGSVTIASEGASFTGEVELQLVKLLSGFALLGEEVSPVSFKYLRVGGEFTTADGTRSFSASATLDVKNAATFDTLLWSDYSGATTDVFSTTDNTLVEAILGVELDSVSDWWLSVNGDFSAGPAGLTVNGDHAVTGDDWDFTDQRTTTAEEYASIEAAIRAVVAEEFDGNTDLAEAVTLGYVDIGGNKSDGAWIWAEIELPNLETAEQFLQASFTLTAKVNIPELQAAQVTSTISRGALNGGSARVNVKWNGGNYTMLASSEDLETDVTVNFRLFNTQGYELNLDLAFASDEEGGDLTDITGKALLNGEQIGTVEFREGAPVIVYPNGDEEVFESLY